jgi:hypothetical protein
MDKESRKIPEPSINEANHFFNAFKVEEFTGLCFCKKNTKTGRLIGLDPTGIID